ncbi:hypothetical protein [Bradyrhizobium jicamae]|uniref:hypothetical protein n=1 Tax=Bradyrhizobium jicamae TaxID=280332 RepID=UPI0012ED3B1A|nr:hypothetical protein [Bradyrhizobium jicamae]
MPDLASGKAQMDGSTHRLSLQLPGSFFEAEDEDFDAVPKIDIAHGAVAYHAN